MFDAYSMACTRIYIFLIALTAFAMGSLEAQQNPAAANDPAERFFASAPVLKIEIQLEPENRESLRHDPREYVPATLLISGRNQRWSNIGIKLKGAAGSFREIDDRPGFTINLGKFGGEKRLHGLKRFHLNNGVQDDSRLSEWLGYEVFTAAGYPAPRVAHAIVTLDGELLGLYVFRESFDKRFLLRTIGATNGNLYDGGFCQDIDRELEKDSGTGPDDHRDLKRLVDACSSFDPEHTAKLVSLINIDAFVDFMALEAMVGHWDGYSQNRNNFRLWCSEDLGQSLFFPHGMDQLFNDADASILQHPSAIVAKSVQQHPKWRELYRDRLTALLPLLQSRVLEKKIKGRATKIQRALKRIDSDKAREHSDAVRNLTARVRDRYRHLKRQVRAPEPEPLVFADNKPIKLDDWNAAGETSGLTIKKRSFQGSSSLYIRCKSNGEKERRGAYRTSVMLTNGKYRMTAIVRTEGLKSPEGTEGGARILVDGKQSESLLGSNKWTELSCDFEVTKFRSNIELRLELRALEGKAWFRTSSLLLHRL